MHFQESENRMHNETFDNLITTGYAGAGAYLLVIAAAFYYSLRYLGFAFNGCGRIVFMLLAGLGVLAGVVLPWAVGAPQVVGIGVEAGLLTGIFVFVAWNGFRKTQAISETNARQLFVLGILGVLTAHLIETEVAFSIAPTHLYFYLCLALLAIICTRESEHSERSCKTSQSQIRALECEPITSFCGIIGSLSYWLRAGVSPSMPRVKGVCPGCLSKPGLFFPLANGMDFIYPRHYWFSC